MGAKERYDCLREGKKLVDEGSPEVLQAVLAKQISNDNVNADAQLLKDIEILLSSYEDVSSKLTGLQRPTVPGSEEFSGFAESYNARAKALQRALVDLSVVPSFPAMTVAEKDAAKVSIQQTASAVTSGAASSSASAPVPDPVPTNDPSNDPAKNAA